jgi:hypothetical protein
MECPPEIKEHLKKMYYGQIRQLSDFYGGVLQCMAGKHLWGKEQQYEHLTSACVLFKRCKEKIILGSVNYFLKPIPCMVCLS